MNKTIKLRVKKEIDRKSELEVLKLKGTLITKGYTEIIHIEDENEDFELHYISVNNLRDIITLLSALNN
ncbi:hypothetical protein SD960_08490 [Flavobacterium sp. MMLR14_040]|uniref:hypothetical protein n=1 Tax=Flavobacterium sp. MMLR14_040 TaxID=3093843 RepID=UPI00298FC7A1|nr:hypothetical protein [Flavobacterium sp. MMLR14_040]MDW8850125.1 hypothetical protein [Flavobacterium sp. MMLR14_040]